MENVLKLNGLNDKQKNIITKTSGLGNERKSKFLDFISGMTSWEFEVFDAFRSRLKIDELGNGLAKEAHDLFLANPDDEVARRLVSVDLHSWRPAGINVFAELVRLHQQRTDNNILDAITKASTIGTKAFKEEYQPKGKVTPKTILEVVLFEDYGISLNPLKPETKTVYDGLREDDQAS